MFPKWNPINPINSARWTGSAQSLVRKSVIASSILVRSMSRLAGSTAAEVPHGMVFFSYFISHFFVVILFERANKIISEQQSTVVTSGGGLSMVVFRASKVGGRMSIVVFDSRVSPTTVESRQQTPTIVECLGRLSTEVSTTVDSGDCCQKTWANLAWFTPFWR